MLANLQPQQAIDFPDIKSIVDVERLAREDSAALRAVGRAAEAHRLGPAGAHGDAQRQDQERLIRLTGANAAIAVAINGGADIGTGALSIAPGAAGTGASDAPANSVGSAQVNEGDFISFTPSGATGSNIPATFHAVIREQ